MKREGSARKKAKSVTGNWLTFTTWTERVLVTNGENFKYEVMINRLSDDNWRKILTIAAKRNRDWPTLSQPANVLLTFNADNATVEHAFSLLSRLGTPKRNRLLSSTVDKLVRLKLNFRSRDHQLMISCFQCLPQIFLN